MNKLKNDQMVNEVICWCIRNKDSTGKATHMKQAAKLDAKASNTDEQMSRRVKRYP